jgi:hypothetical protein
MNRTEYHNTRRKKFAELAKNRVDSAYEYYCALSDEEKQISKHAFSRKLATHLSIGTGVARNVTNNLIAEYKVEFVKYKMSSSHSRGFTGKKHSAETRAKIAAASIKCNAARAIKCKEQGLNYRNYKQDADKNIDVANFSKTFNNNTRISSISSENIII